MHSIIASTETFILSSPPVFLHLRIFVLFILVFVSSRGKGRTVEAGMEDVNCRPLENRVRVIFEQSNVD